MPPTNLQRIQALTDSLEEFSESFDTYVLFIDLCRSSEIKQHCLEKELPDSFWITGQKIFLGRTASIVHQYDGVVVKTIGDEIMATFAPDYEPDRIVRCCIEAFQAYAGLRTYNRGPYVIARTVPATQWNFFRGQRKTCRPIL